MKGRRIQIDELRLRTTGLSREQARRLGETVAQRLAEASFAGTKSQKVPAVTVRVGPATKGSTDQLAKEIARKVRQSLD